MVGPVDDVSSGLRGRTVLVVDDEEDIVETVKMTIEAFLEGIQVRVATSGAAGLLVLRETHVDLIVTDYKMPGMNGLEFLHEASEMAPRTSRVMMTAYPDMELAIQALNDEHITSFLQKPLQRQQVVEVIRRVLSERQKTQERQRALLEAMRVCKGLD